MKPFTAFALGWFAGIGGIVFHHWAQEKYDLGPGKQRTGYVNCSTNELVIYDITTRSKQELTETVNSSMILKALCEKH